MSIESIAEKEVAKKLEEISGLDVDGDEYCKAVEGTCKLIDRLNDAEKIRNETRKNEIAERQLDLEYQKLNADKKKQILGTAVTVGTFVAAAAINVWSVLFTTDFENNGGMQSTEAGKTSTRNLLNFMNKHNR